MAERCRFETRISEEQLMKLERKAKDYGMTKSGLIKKYIEDEPLIDIELRELIRDMIKEVNKIGTNINQIARKANENSLSKNDVLSLRAYQKALIDTVKEVKKYCYNKNITHEGGEI